MGAGHENLLQRSALLVQKTFPNSRFITRHVGMFKTMRGTPIRIGMPGQGDAYVYINTGKCLAIIELEFKVGNDRQSKDQKNWQSAVESIGVIYLIVKDEKLVIQQITEALIEKNYL